MEIGDERGTDPIDAWRRGMGRRGGGGSFFFSRRKRKRREGGWVQAVAPRDGRLVSCRGDGSLCFGPANERNGIGEPLDVNSRLPMASLRMFSLWHPGSMERGGEKDWSSLETRGCGFHDSFDSSTAGAGGAGRKRGRTRWDHFSLFPQKTSPGFHDPSAVPGPPVTRAAGQDGADGTMDLGSARPPLSRACLPKLVCLSTSLFLQRDCGQNCKAPLQSHTRDKPTRASLRMVGS